MSKTLLNVKTDRQVKREAVKIAAQIGVPLSTVVNAFLKEFVRERKVTFSVDSTPRPEIVSIIKKASADYQKGKNISPTFSSPQKILSFLKR